MEKFSFKNLATSLNKTERELFNLICERGGGLYRKIRILNEDIQLYMSHILDDRDLSILDTKLKRTGGINE